MLRIENLSFSYGKQKIYENFNLHVPGNQVCLVTGINGVGKSTLLRLIAGVLKPAGGKIIFDEKLGPDHREKMGFISDRPSLYEDLTVDNGIRLHKSVYGISEFDDTLIRHTKIQGNQKIKNLSIGQRTIFHLSLILSAKPEILLVDEIIHAIDVYLRRIYLQQLTRLVAQRKLTMIMVNLNFHDIENVVDRVILLKDAEIAVDEKIDSLKNKVKKIVAHKPPVNLPILSHLNFPGNDSNEYFIYPYREEYRDQVDGSLVDLNLTEIISAFIGGEYA